MRALAGVEHATPEVVWGCLTPPSKLGKGVRYRQHHRLVRLECVDRAMLCNLLFAHYVRLLRSKLVLLAVTTSSCYKFYFMVA